MHCSQRRLLRRRLEFYVCTFNKSAHTKISLENYRMYLIYIYIYIYIYICMYIYIYPLGQWAGYIYIYIYIYIYNQLIGLVDKVFTNGPGDLGSVPGRVIPKTLKMLLDTSLLNTQQYKVRIKGKVEQSRERISALPYTSV